MTRSRHKPTSLWLMELAASFDNYGDTDEHKDIKDNDQ